MGLLQVLRCSFAKKTSEATGSAAHGLARRQARTPAKPGGARSNRSTALFSDTRHRNGDTHSTTAGGIRPHSRATPEASPPKNAPNPPLLTPSRTSQSARIPGRAPPRALRPLPGPVPRPADLEPEGQRYTSPKPPRRSNTLPRAARDEMLRPSERAPAPRSTAASQVPERRSSFYAGDDAEGLDVPPGGAAEQQEGQGVGSAEAVDEDGGRGDGNVHLRHRAALRKRVNSFAGRWYVARGFISCPGREL